jgi:hypothetical protein
VNYFKLFGQPISHPGVQQLIRQYLLVDEFKDILANVEAELALEIPNFVSTRAHFEHHLSRFSNILDDEYIELVIGLSAARWTEKELGPEHVKVVDLLQFWHNFSGVFPLDFDPKTPFHELNLGVLISKGKGYYGGFTADFLVDGYEVSAHYTSLTHFAGLTIKKMSENTLQKLQFEATLKDQKPHINRHFHKEIPALLAASPVLKWQARRADGDGLFTDAGLESAAQIIHDYLIAVAAAAQKSSARQIMSAIKQVVKHFNKLNKSKSSLNMVETSEREDLVPFIDAAAKAAGLHIPAGYDVTLEWRDW